MAAILGITSTENWDSYRDKNRRRSVQYMYPQGKFPLLGLLSLMDSEEETNDPYFSHQEYRWTCPRTTTINHTGSGGPIAQGADKTTAETDPVTLTAGSEYYIKVTSGDEQKFYKGDVVRLLLDTTSANNRQFMGWITELPTTSGATYLKVKAINTLANVKNGATDENVGKTVLYAGNAFAEGRSNVDIQQRTEIPVEVYNYTQIHRTKISFTRREMKTPVVFDKSGTYKHRTREQLLRHMVGIENMLLWGARQKDTGGGTGSQVVPSTGAYAPTTFAGGILWYLEQWEAQYSLYRGGNGSSTGPAAVTLDSDDEKRIIENSTGVITEEMWDTYMERIFRFTSNTSGEKLWIGGNKQLLVLNQLARSKSNLWVEVPHKDAYGYEVWKWVTPFGTLYLKTHPLFNDIAELNYNAFIIDVKNLKYRAYKDSDTVLLKNRGDRDYDGIVNEWFSDCGLEMWQPESCMYMKNVQSFVP